MTDDRILAIACNFMRAYLSDGRIRQPSDFDGEILGRAYDASDLMLMRAPAWNATVFCKALGQLVDAGEVRAWQNDDGEWFYQTVQR